MTLTFGQTNAILDRIHMQKQAGNEWPTYVCQLCGQDFAFYVDLATHLRDYEPCSTTLDASIRATFKQG